MPNVTIIPATINRKTSAPITENIKRKVAAYARVSTDQDEQLTSYTAQVDYYTNYIKSREDWEFVGIYADEGISGCNTRHRDGFNRMIEDALNGKIQLIITKSVSRFARNTVDSLSTIRKLKDKNVECYFEKEGLWTFDSKSEVILSIMSSLSQEESRSISENVKWGVRKKFEDGKFSLPYSRFLGYDKGENGLVINENEAKIVHRIYGLFLSGKSVYQIAKILTADGIPTVTGKRIWNAGVIKGILTNEKYKGCALLQKQFTVNYLTKEMKTNNGEVPQYFVKDSHPAIIEPYVFDQVQRLIEMRNRQKGKQSSTTLFSSKIKCGCCGGWYGSKVWHSNDKYRRVIYRCNNKYNGEKCSTPHFTEDEIKQMFIKAINLYCTDRDKIINTFEEIRQQAFDTTNLEQEQTEKETELNAVAGLIEDLIAENAHRVQDQTEYEKRYNSLAERFEKAKVRIDEVKSEITKIRAESENMERFIKQLRKTPNIITEFDEECWYGLVDSITVHSKENITFTFKDGKTIKI